MGVWSGPDTEAVRMLLIEAAREELLARFERVTSERKADGSVLTEADVAMQERVQRALAERWPEYGFLGEESGTGAQGRAFAEHEAGLWCLDPLDGTSNFARGIPFFGFSLAFLADGAVQAGWVYDPVRDECFTAVRGDGAWLNGEALDARRAPEAPLAGGIGLTDFKRLPAALAERLAREPPYASQRSFGSVALDWCWLAAGRVHVYLHGKQKLWDYAAGSLILDEAGGRAVTLEGEPVFNGTLDPRSVAAALDHSLFEEWTAWLGIKR